MPPPAAAFGSDVAIEQPPLALPAHGNGHVPNGAAIAAPSAAPDAAPAAVWAAPAHEALPSKRRKAACSDDDGLSVDSADAASPPEVSPAGRDGAPSDPMADEPAGAPVAAAAGWQAYPQLYTAAAPAAPAAGLPVCGSGGSAPHGGMPCAGAGGAAPGAVMAAPEETLQERLRRATRAVGARRHPLSALDAPAAAASGRLQMCLRARGHASHVVAPQARPARRQG